MLTKRQNLLEVINCGNPDRYVNQWEAFAIQRRNPMSVISPSVRKGQTMIRNAWGVYRSFPENVPGAFPVHDPEHIVIKDVEHWRDYIPVIPSVKFPEAQWEEAIAAAEAVDRNEQFVTTMITPGVFEQCHYLMEIQNCLVALYEYPDEMHEIIDMYTDFELAYAEEICRHLHPDALAHHDDWGTQRSTFMSPEMFEEFFVPAYKQIYGYYKDHGVQVIVHHSDSYAATLVPQMIDLGIDIWQGVMRSNDIPAMLKEYTGKITFMGGINSADVDFEGTTQEVIRGVVERAIQEGSKHSFIPCCTMGGPGSIYPGVYDMVSAEIARINENF